MVHSALSPTQPTFPRRLAPVQALESRDRILGSANCPISGHGACQVRDAVLLIGRESLTQDCEFG